MDYARTVLGLPVPEVRAWSAHASSSHGVGTEFIIMDKVPGVELSSRWSNLTYDQWQPLVMETVDLTARFCTRKFSQIGSIFYKEDVSKELQKRPLYAEGEEMDEASEKFRIGPLVDWSVWRGDRAKLTKADRGPC